VVATKVAAVVVVAGLDRLEAEAAFGAAVSTPQPRRSVACKDPSERDRAEAELASAYRATLHLERGSHIGGLSLIMHKLADP
jgi:hypothetical protein